jgi:hypothetical protein
MADFQFPMIARMRKLHFFAKPEFWWGSTTAIGWSFPSGGSLLITLAGSSDRLSLVFADTCAVVAATGINPKCATEETWFTACDSGQLRGVYTAFAPP